MSEFKVGEVLVGQNLIVQTTYNGMECTVLRQLCRNCHHEGLGYEVEWADGLISWQSPYTLRRKQPPSGEQSVYDMFKLPAPSKTMEAA